MSSDPIAIIAAKRTPLGAFQGVFSPVSATELSAIASRAAIAQCQIDASVIDEVLLGCVLPAGLGQAPARQAALAAGLPLEVPCTTINKVCGSGMKTTMLAHDLITAGSASVVLAGGMESMSNAPYLMPKARSGYRMGHQQVLDHMFFDGLQNPGDGNMMGHFADLTADKYQFSREDQDQFAIASVTRARQATANGHFVHEIAPVAVNSRKGKYVVATDEGPERADTEKIPQLKAAFRSDGTVTAASSSSISDGAASLILMKKSQAQDMGIEVLATIAGQSTFAQDPAWFTTSPVYAVKALQKKLDWNVAHVDLYEINEAFACVTMAAMQDVGIDHGKVNVNGGACALGHPIGASGARIIVTLVHALRGKGGGRGIASLCIGGGEATAIGIEV